MRVLGMTTRKWTVAVAIIAVVLHAWRIESLQQVTRDRLSTALGYAFQEYEAKKTLDWAESYLGQAPTDFDKILSKPGLPPVTRAKWMDRLTQEIARRKAIVESSRNKVNYAARMRSRYEYAAARPLLPLDPDPPAPK